MMATWMVPMLAAGLVVSIGMYLVERRAAVRGMRGERKAFEQRLALLRVDHQAEIERLVKTYDRLLDTQKVSMQEALRLATTGSPVAVEARVEDREADATERLARQVSEETIARGVEMLRDSYRDLGITMSDEELRDEAIMLLSSGMNQAGFFPSEPVLTRVPAEARA